MKIKIEDKKENLLLKRQDIMFFVEHTGTATPPRLNVRAKLAAMLNCKEDQLFIIKLNGLFGQSVAQGYAHLYPSKEAALMQEQTHIIKRHSQEEPAPPVTAEPPPKEEVETTPKKPEEVKAPPKKEVKPEEVKAPPKKEVKPKAATKPQTKTKKTQSSKPKQKKEESSRTAPAKKTNS